MWGQRTSDFVSFSAFGVWIGKWQTHEMIDPEEEYKTKVKLFQEPKISLLSFVSFTVRFYAMYNTQWDALSLGRPIDHPASYFNLFPCHSLKSENFTIFINFIIGSIFIPYSFSKYMYS